VSFHTFIRALGAAGIGATALAAILCNDAAAGPPSHDALLGTWEADIAHSTFVGRAPYRTGIMTISKDKAAVVHLVADVVTASGAPFHFEYAGKDDGTAVPVTGNPYYDGAATVWENDHRAVRTELRAGKPIGKTTMVVAADGQSYTANSSRSTPEDGHLYTSMILWRKSK
jgi:hypothetical protein